MAVCKRCGCAIPLGRKACEMCAITDSIAPAQQPPVWQPPTELAPIELASSASSWARGPGTTTPVGPPSTEVAKARKNLKWAWQVAAFIGAINVGLGALAELVPIPTLLRFVDWASAVEGAIYIVLAFFIRRGSRIALGITVALLGLDMLAAVLSGQVLGLGLPVRILIIIALVRGFHAISVLRRANALSPASQSRAA